MVLLDNCSDVGSFGLTGITGTEMIRQITAKSGTLQKNFDIACLTVADNEKRAVHGKKRKDFRKAGIDLCGVCKKSTMFFHAAMVDQLQLSLLFKVGEQNRGDIRQRFSE